MFPPIARIASVTDSKESCGPGANRTANAKNAKQERI